MPTPTLSLGSKLGPYEILGPLGRGGMGEVFRARDSRLGREVAVKALPQAFAADPERLARFEREARLLASLSHPNIAGIHGLEDVDGHRFLILELVEGGTLGDRLDAGPLALDESLEIGRQIAAALEAAHEAGIVHRDLKPGNVMLTPGGAVKVLDFGLAKGGAGSGSSSDINISASPTMTYAATEVGVILGTAAYMSPEQARGRAVDRRTDIWSFGCVLYECLTGRQLFAGETVSDTVAKILEREPDWNALPARTPQRVRELLRRCLEKDAKKRLRDIGDARVELDELLALGATGLATASSASDVGAAPTPVARVAWLPWAVTAVALLALGVGWMRSGGPMGSKNAGAVRATIMGPPGHSISTRPADAALSPDGRWIVMAVGDSSGSGGLWLRPFDALDARPLSGAELGAIGISGLPFWSPDGHMIGYFSEGKLKTIPMLGGEPQILCDAPDPRGGSWGRGGVILFSPTSQSPVFRVSASGGDPVQVTHLDSTAHETAHRFPTFLPDGVRFTYTALPEKDGKFNTWLESVQGGRRSLVLSAESGARFAPPNHLVYVRNRALMAVEVSPSNLGVKGEPMVIGEAPANLSTAGTPPVAMTATGALLYPTAQARSVRAVWYGRDGKPQGELPIPPGDDREYAVSPDNHRIAIARYSTATTADLWIAEIEKGSFTRLTSDGIERRSLTWSPDGKRIAYNTSGGAQDLRVRSADGTEDDELLFRGPGMFKTVDQWTRDGKYLLYEQRDAATRLDVWALPLEGDRTPKPLFRTSANEGGASISPDGRWILYVSDETGRNELYARSFPDLGNKMRLTKDGGFGAGWSADGKEIFLGTAAKFCVLPVRDPATLDVGPIIPLFDIPRSTQAAGIRTDVQRILIGLPAGEESPDRFTLLVNWTGLANRR